jgi:hypothetical protein
MLHPSFIPTLARQQVWHHNILILSELDSTGKSSCRFQRSAILHLLEITLGKQSRYRIVGFILFVCLKRSLGSSLLLLSSSAESMSDIPVSLMFSKHHYSALQAVTFNICRELSMRAGQAGSQSICRSSVSSLLDSFSQFVLISHFLYSFCTFQQR